MYIHIHTYIYIHVFIARLGARSSNPLAEKKLPVSQRSFQLQRLHARVSLYGETLDGPLPSVERLLGSQHTPNVPNWPTSIHLHPSL